MLAIHDNLTRDDALTQPYIPYKRTLPIRLVSFDFAATLSAFLDRSDPITRVQETKGWADVEERLDLCATGEGEE